MATIQTSATKIGQVSIHPRGEYSSSTEYHILDVVTSNGSSYICIQNCQNIAVSNTSYWYLLASKGDTYEVTEEDLQRIATQIEQDASSMFNQNVTQKTNDFNTNATNKTTDFNTNATNKTTAFNENASSETGDFNSNATSKTGDFNSNAISKTNDFNTNANNKTISFDANANDKTTLFNGNATTKTTAFNENADSKTGTFNTNATNKTTDFNTNASDKTTAFNQNFAEKNSMLEKNFTVHQSKVITGNGQLTDSMYWNTENLNSFGGDDVSQDTSKKTYKCIGTEVGDYYFVYDNTNYQFTMPTISAGSILVFDTTTTKLYLGETEIITSTASTGTLITLTDTPNPAYPQPIKYLTGNVSTIISNNENLFNKNDSSSIYNGYIVAESSPKIVSYSSNRTIVVPVIAGKTYTISKNLGQSRIRYAFSSVKPVMGSTVMFDSVGSLPLTTTVTAPSGANYIAVFVYGSSDGTAGYSAEDILGSIRVELGSTASPYQIFPLTLGDRYLGKLGTAENIIFKNTKNNPNYDSTLTENAWYYKKGWDKITLDGTETLAYVSDTLRITTSYTIYASSDAVLKSNKFQYAGRAIDASTAYGKGNNTFSLNPNGTRLYFRYDTLTTEELWTTWLSTANVEIDLPLATATYTQITDSTLVEQLEALAQFLTYRNITNFAITGGDIAGELNFNYYVDDRVAINARLDLLEN